MRFVFVHQEIRSSKHRLGDRFNQITLLYLFIRQQNYFNHTIYQLIQLKMACFYECQGHFQRFIYRHPAGIDLRKKYLLVSINIISPSSGD